MTEPVRVPRAFAERFHRVVAALGFTEEDIAIAKEGVRRDFDAWRDFVESEDCRLVQTAAAADEARA